MLLEARRQTSFNHCTEINHFPSGWYHSFFLPEARRYQRKWEAKEKPEQILKGEEIALLLFEASLRTERTFTKAAKGLGANVWRPSDPAKELSLLKGETLQDTLRVLRVLDYKMLVMRSSVEGQPQEVAGFNIMPVANAGDGASKHPSQALQDGLTVSDHFDDDTKGRTVVFTGDCGASRVMKEDMVLMHKELGMNIIFAAHSSLQVTSDTKKYLRRLGIPFEQEDSLIKAIEKADVVVPFRLQTERRWWLHNLPKPVARMLGKMLIKGESASLTPEVMDIVEKQNAIIMAPLPRNDALGIMREFPDRYVDHPQVLAFNKQLSNGVPARQAILEYMYDSVRAA